MSSLRDRLQRMKVTGTEKQSTIGTEAAASDTWTEIGARLFSSEFGAFVHKRIEFAADTFCGSWALGAFSGVAEQLSGAICAQPLSHERVLFLDTETTGLGVGAGNVPFLVGIGYYEADRFIVEQLFIRNPGEEQAMLRYLDDKLASFSHLATYNGKTFDWPLLKNRYVLNRITPFRDDMEHIDFLYPSRSLWRNTLTSCRLGNVEEERLGVRRNGDVPGSLAPTLYFEYLSSGNPMTIEGVFRHNEQDIVTLAALAIYFASLLQGDVSLYRMENEELYRLGLWYDKVGKPQEADRVFTVLLDRNPREAGAYWTPLAAYYKKKGRMDRAVSLWQKAADASESGRLALELEPLLELAMYHEHKSRDWTTALIYAEEALSRAGKRMSLLRGDPKQRMLVEGLRKRVDRLARKLSASADRPYLV